MTPKKIEVRPVSVKSRQGERNWMSPKITEKEFNQAKQQLLNIPVVMQQSGQLFCSMAGKGFCPYEYENGKCKVEGKCTNHTTK